MLAAQDGATVQHELLARLDQARVQTDRLFDLVKPDFLYERPIPERHRIIFYVGHLEAFDWNLLRERVFGRTSFHSEFDQLFAFGIDPVAARQQSSKAPSAGTESASSRSGHGGNPRGLGDAWSFSGRGKLAWRARLWMGQRVRSAHRPRAGVFHRSVPSKQPRVSPVHERGGI